MLSTLPTMGGLGFLDTLDIALRGAAIALFLVIALATLRQGRGRPAAWLGALLAVGAAAYAVCSSPGPHGDPPPWFAPVLVLCTGNAAVFWLFARALFDDSFRLKPWHALVWLGLVVWPVAHLFGTGITTHWLVGVAVRVAVILLALLALVQTVRGYKGFSQAGPLYLVGSLALMLVAHDTYFYWAHRAMHHRRLFALFHRTHHLSRTPTPWAAYSFAVPEAIVHAAFVPLFLLVVPMHGLGLLAFGIVQILRNVMGHAGAEVHSAAFGPGRWLGWNNTTTHHDLHHEAGRYNYGLYFRWWDKLMGTEHPDYCAKFEAIVAPEAKTTSPAIAGRVLVRTIAGSVLAGGLLLAADPAQANESTVGGLAGRWATPGVAAIVELAPCTGATGLCGTVRWLWDAVDDKGRPRLDAQNADAALRTRPLVGLSILSGLTRSSKGGWEGRIYNPEDGQTYRATVRQTAADTLMIEGCVLFICQKQVWRSASALVAAFR